MRYFVFFVVLLAQATLAQDLTESLAGKRWGLEHMIQPYLTEQIDDTLFSAINCQSEFLDLKQDGSYQLQAQDKIYTGTWKITPDSTLRLYKKNGKINTQFQLIALAPDAGMTLVERFKGQSFIYVYFLCTPEQMSRVEDTRAAFEVNRWQGLTTGIYALDQRLELGYSWGKTTWNKIFLATGPSLDLAPWNGLYGASWGFWSHKIFAFGVHLNAFTDTERVQFGLTPSIGAGLPGKFGQLTYGYHFLFLEDGVRPLDPLSRHNISLRIVWPWRKETYNVYQFEK
ncbi:MAG: hypothetical protein ACFCUI_03735 [Bernardetiaceae bacterium]